MTPTQASIITAADRPTDLYESTPHSGGYYHSSASYWANGGLDTLGLFSSAGASLIPLQTYGADGEGRPSSVTAASGQNPVSSVTYTASGTAEPIGSLTNVTFGSLDSDSYQYNPSTGRMTKYTLSVNGQSEVGSLTWNANGTLGQLAIVDPFNTQNNQTCTNTYDDLARISGNSCTPSVWAQTFSYDPFGNISKSGSISWQPIYNSPTNDSLPINNQYKSGWSGVSYDANGSLLNDSFNTYTWNVYGDLASANGAAIVYDAFDRMVENRSGTYEFAYAPTGTHPLVWLQGQTLSGAQLPLPGNAFAIYNGSGLAQYNHADWLGSARLFSTPARVASPAMSYAPFGEGYAGGIQDIQFTSFSSSYTVSGTESQGGTLDDFTFRRYSPVQGRWISPDPAGLAAVNPANPQTWNRYAYVANNPLSHTDRLGTNEDECDPDDDSCDDDGGGGGGPDGGQPQQPDPVGIPGFCDASCGGSGFGGGVDSNGIPNNFGPGYLAQSTSGLSNLLSQEAQYLARIYDPCVYTNDNGSYNVDPNSSPGECSKTQGHWVPPGALFTVDGDGNVHIFQTPILPEPPTIDRCHGYVEIGEGLGLAAALNEGGAFVTGEASPVSAYFHGMAVGEGIGAAGLAIYGDVFCKN